MRVLQVREEVVEVRIVEGAAMKQFCVLAVFLALALAEPTIYFKETFEDGKSEPALAGEWGRSLAPSQDHV